MFHEEALGDATPALADEILVKARGLTKTYAAGEATVHPP